VSNEPESIGWDEPQPPEKVRLLVTVPSLLPWLGGPPTRLATRSDLLRACAALGWTVTDEEGDELTP